MKFFPKILRRFHVNVWNYTQYVKDFFLLNGILSKLLTISTLYQGNIVNFDIC
jgi:hypothetical protein